MSSLNGSFWYSQRGCIVATPVASGMRTPSHGSEFFFLTKRTMATLNRRANDGGQ